MLIYNIHIWNPTDEMVCMCVCVCVCVCDLAYYFVDVGPFIYAIHVLIYNILVVVFSISMQQYLFPTLHQEWPSLPCSLNLSTANYLTFLEEYPPV